MSMTWKLPAGMLHVAIGHSTIAYGQLASLELQAVRAAPGVVDVITFSDLEHATDIAPVFRWRSITCRWQS